MLASCHLDWVGFEQYETLEVVMCPQFGEQISPLFIVLGLLAVHAIPHPYVALILSPHMLSSLR